MIREALKLFDSGGLNIDPVYLSSKLRQRLGDELFGALVAERVLQPADPASWYPCPGGGHDCPREVITDVGDAEYPHVAVPSSTACCLPVRLTDADIEQHSTSVPDFVRVLRSELSLSGDYSLNDTVFPNTHRIGQQRVGSSSRDVLLSTNPSYGGFDVFLRSLKQNPQGSLVLAPLRTRWIPAGLEALFAPDDRVQLAYLEDMLEVRDSRLRRVGLASGCSMAAEQQPRYTPAPKTPVCVLHDERGERSLGQAEYEAVLEQFSSFDLIIDMTQVGQFGSYRAGRRTQDGAFEPVSLSRNHARALAELITRAKPLRGAELRTLDVSRPNKIIEQARRKLDIRRDRYEWTALHTLRGDTPSEKQFIFRPPVGFRYAVIQLPDS